MKKLSFIIYILATFLINVELKAQIPNGVYFIHLNNGYVMEAEGNTYMNNGCKIQNWTNYDGLNQRWEVTRTTTGTYRMKNLGSNKMLDAHAPDVNTNGGKVQLWDNYPSNRNQEWILMPLAGGKYAIKNAASSGNKVLDVTGRAVGTVGTAIQLWDFVANSANQTWTFLPTNTPRYTNLPYNTWKNLMNTLISRTSYFKINNYTPTDFQYDRRNAYRYYKPNDVKYRIGGAGSTEQTMDLFPQRVDPFTVYFKNMNGRIQEIAAENGKLKIVLVFESDDVEAPCNCVENIVCGGTGNPNFHINNLKCVVWAEPYAEGGQLKVRNIDLKLAGNLDHEGFNFTVAHLQPFIYAFNGPIFDFASNEFKKVLNRPENLAAFNQNINAGLAGTGFFGTAPHLYRFKIESNGNLNYVYR